MVRRLTDLFKRTLNVIRGAVMADGAPSTGVAVVGEKRAAPDSPTHQKPKKKKKPHIVTLGKEEGCKRKIALLVAYNGAGYYGVQINRGFKTIESDLFDALIKSEAVPQAHVDDTSKMWFQRGSRTDKGVSAIGQTFSMKLVIVPNLVDKLNEHLPGQIRVIGYRRTTNGFDSKNFCCARTYMYMTPTFAFAPFEKYIIPEEYRITDDRLEQVRSILNQYVGTHKFHNFTSGVKKEQANAQRYIICFECSDKYVRDGVEFVTLRVKGQSFMLHQIRKMIGLTIAIVRGYCGESALQKSWDAERVDVPRAPGLGLVLETLHFDGYNKKFGCDGVHDPIEWSAHKETMDEFKEKYIISDIVEQEKRDKSMMNWLQTLQFHSFDEPRTDGPRKPWVKTEKLLANKSPSGDATMTASCGNDTDMTDTTNTSTQQQQQVESGGLVAVKTESEVKVEKVIEEGINSESLESVRVAAAEKLANITPQSEIGEMVKSEMVADVKGVKGESLMNTDTSTVADDENKKDNNMASEEMVKTELSSSVKSDSTVS